MADSASGNLGLPRFEAGKTYLLTGETLLAITNVIRENRVVPTGRKQFDEIGPEGSKIDLDLLTAGAARATGTWVLGAIAGYEQWIPTTSCTSGGIDGGNA